MPDTSALPKRDKAPHPGGKSPRPVSAIKPSESWSLDDTRALYGVDRWGSDYFRINEAGHAVVKPIRGGDGEIDLKQLVDELRLRGLELPLLLRFTDILHDRVARMHETFAHAIKENDYQGGYRLVYPIKVNQQRHVVEEILEFGKPYGFGLEAGSKPELLAVMAMVDDDVTPIICNGFKDDAYIEAVILAAKMGRHIIPVVEKYSELELIARYAAKHQVKPRIGLRVKLAARGAGRWEQSGGVRSKFGLFVNEVLDAMAFLKQHDMADCLQLLHFHLGSQVNNIRNIKRAIIEQARIYVEMQKIGANLQYLDVGGGLGVDYDGSNTDFESSINYSLQEYANDVIYHVKQICDQAGVSHPTIISESGRALVAHHSVLVFNVLGATQFGEFKLPESLDPQERKKTPGPVITLFESYHDINRKNFTECFHDAQVARDETINLFNLGYCSLEHRSLAERLFFAVCTKVRDLVRELDYVPEDFQDLEMTLADIYFCNLSVFQSLPDSWAIDQLFPIMPIHRLNEQPTTHGILADVSCDSDGKIDRFIDLEDVKHALELHPLNGEDYLLAAFLVGAYQEILGDLHNLFGDTNAVHIRLGENNEVNIEEVVEGDTVREVLEYVQFNSEQLMRSMRRGVEQALRKGQINLDEARVLLRFYESSLKGYTYLE